MAEEQAIILILGVFNLRPSIPRYVETWDIQLVLQKLQAMGLLCSLSLKELTLKLVMLMVLTQAARVQTLHLLLFGTIHSEKDSFFYLVRGQHIKQCRPKFNMYVVTCKAYAKNNGLYVCKTLKKYIVKTEVQK